ncbi:MAG: cytochrome b/b6 domain-containing protein [Sulfuriferula sp.]
MSSQDAGSADNNHFYYRHTLAMRMMHWIGAIAFFLLLMSGLQIFNAHPALNWGESSYTGRPPVLEMGAKQTNQGNIIGVTTIFGHEFNTTGIFGWTEGADGELTARGFPAWITLPGTQWLAMARRWHFFFAWVLVIDGVAYLLYSLFSHHLRRDLVPTPRDWRSIRQSIKNHLRLHHPSGEATRRYNILQKLAYLSVIFGLFPLIILMGWAMSPGLDALIPGWVDIVGGRQSARTIHFMVAWALVVFVLIHLFEVMISGAWNNLRSMITGHYRVTAEEPDHDRE